MEGFLLVALGRPIYGEMAFNLCLSLKAANPAVKVALVWCHNSIDTLSDQQKGLFDHIIQAEKEWHTHKYHDYIKSKTHLYEMSPFDRTIFLDADTLWITGRDPMLLFEELRYHLFSIMTFSWAEMENLHFGNVGYTFWGKLQNIKKYYKFRTEKLPMTYSNLVYFTKTPQMESYFRTLQGLYTDMSAPVQTKFASGRPDEFYYNVCCAKTRIYPHKMPWTPVYCFHVHQHSDGRVLTKDEIFKKFYVLGLGGNYVPDFLANIHNDLLSKLSYQTGHQSFPYKSKASALPERANF